MWATLCPNITFYTRQVDPKTRQETTVANRFVQQRLLPNATSHSEPNNRRAPRQEKVENWLKVDKLSQQVVLLRTLANCQAALSLCVAWSTSMSLAAACGIYLWVVAHIYSCWSSPTTPGPLLSASPNQPASDKVHQIQPSQLVDTCRPSTLPLRRQTC